MARGVLVLDGNLANLEQSLRRKNFRIITLPMGVVDPEHRALFLSHRTLVTRSPQEFEDEVSVLEYSIIDATGVTSDDATLADMINQAWTDFRLKTEGWFVLRLRQDGKHQIEFPE
jgi:hypothetical protein